MRDAVGAADRVRAAVTAGIDSALAGAPAPVTGVHVTWAAALDVAGCPARYRAQGEAAWGFPGWSPATAAGAVARSALDLHLDEVGGGAAHLPAPLEAVRRWTRTVGTRGAPGVAGWVAERRDEGDTATLAATAAAAARWLGGFLRVTGWPLPAGLVLANVTRLHGPTRAAKWWPRRGAPVSVGSGADARIGRVAGAGTHVLVVHRPVAGDEGEVARRAAFEATAGALVHRVAPAAVVVGAGDTGERIRVEVGEDLLDAGAALVLGVVHQRVSAVTRGFDPTDATPSPRCRWCDEAPRCPPGTEWLAGPGRWRGGLPSLTPGDVAPAP